MALKLNQDGITVDVSSLAKAFTSMKKAPVKEAVKAGLEASGGKIIRDARRYAPRDRGRLRAALNYRVVFNRGGEGELMIVPTDEVVKNYWLTVEFGPRGGVIRGKPTLSFAFEASPVFSKIRDVRASQVIANPKSYGFDYTMARGGMIFGVKKSRVKRAKTKRGKGSRGSYGKEFVPLFVRARQIEQPEFPQGRFAMRSIRENVGLVDKNVIKEIRKLLG